MIAYSKTSEPCPHNASLTWTTETWTDRDGCVTKQRLTETRDVVGSDGRTARRVVGSKGFAQVRGYRR